MNPSHAESRTEAIEHSLSQSQSLDFDTFEHLAEAAGLLSEAEAAFSRLAEPGWK